MEDNTLKERYVELDTAKLLKEKGFNIPVSMAYDNYGIEGKIYDTFGYNNHNKHDDLISAPTQAMAMQWLREIKAIFFEARLCIGEMTDKGLYQLEIFEKTEPDEYTHRGFVYGNTYEEACENFIIYCLEHVL